MSARLLSVPIVLLALAIAHGAHAAPAASGNAAAPRALGQNLAGEECRVAGAARPGQPLDVLCGKASEPMARLRVAALATALPQQQAARRAAIQRDVKAMPGGFGANEQMTCDGGQWIEAGGEESVVYLCTLASNGWPRVIVARVHQNTLYKAEGLPVMAPVLYAAIAGASGRPISDGESRAAVRLLESRLSAKVLHASAADFAGYKQLVELGRLHGGGGNYAGAEAAYRQALEIETRLFGPDASTVGQTLAELALQVSNQERFDEAAALFRRASAIMERSASAAARARLASYLALDAANQRRFADALKFARQASAARRAEIAAAGGGKDIEGGTASPPVSRGELAHSLRIEAKMALRLDDVAGARAAAEEALWIVSEEPGLPLWWRPEAVSLMGEINEREARVVTAERDYKDALALDQKLFGDSAPTALAHIKLGEFYSGQQLYPAAVASYRAAFLILAKDRIARSQVVSDQIVPFVTASVAVAKSDPSQRAALEADVFRASQLVDSGVADATIARAAVRQMAGNPALAGLVREAQEAERSRDNTRINLAAEIAKADEERNAERERKLAADLKVASTKADELAARVQQAFPDYARLANPGPAGLSELQAQLRPGEAFLSFVIGVKESYALLATRQGFAIERLDVAAQKLAEDVADLRRAFVPRLGGLSAFSLKSSFELYRKLLGPMETELGQSKHLIVAASGELASLPFSLLITAAPASPSYMDAAWLIRRMALSQVPSPRALLSLRAANEHRVAAARPFLGFGDPAFSGSGAAQAKALGALASGCRESGPIAPALLRALPPLHETAAEVRSAARTLGGDSASVLLGAQASESNLRAHPLEQYAVLYFATHGLLPGELHCQGEPGLVLSPPAHAANSTDADGLLEAGEIAGLKLNADLVVLSACNTAAAGGKRLGGGALEGLADSFFNAGARSVLASHWEVPSASTQRLMTGVFDRLGQGNAAGLADALRQSQLALVAQPATAHPFHWAAFSVIGDGGASLGRARRSAGQSVGDRL